VKCNAFAEQSSRQESRGVFFVSGQRAGKNNYFFDKKKVKLFFTVFFLVLKSRFITSAGGGVGARVIKRLFLAREQNYLFEQSRKYCVSRNSRNR
jgi:hypothetical protein